MRVLNLVVIFSPLIIFDLVWLIPVTVVKIVILIIYEHWVDSLFI